MIADDSTEEIINLATGSYRNWLLSIQMGDDLLAKMALENMDVYEQELKRRSELERRRDQLEDGADGSGDV